jgi:transposase
MAAQMTLKTQYVTTTATSVSRRTPSGSYRQDWTAYNAAKTNERRLFPLLLRELCSCIEEPEQILGRPRYLLNDMIFCAVSKVFTKSPSRQFADDAFQASCKELIKKAPHYNTISKYLRMELLTEKLTNLIEISSLPLETVESDFAVDSTGLSTCRYSRWMDERDMQEHSRREWIKLHLICGVKTNIVASVITTPGRDADGPLFGRLVETAARNFQIKEISADKGYLSAENLRYAMLAKATPFIPFKSNNRLDADYKSTIWKDMLYKYLYHRDEFLAHYNKRNNVETTFRMIKANFGASLFSISRQAQFNEALCKVLCHNICVLIRSMFDLGIEPTFYSEPTYDSAKSEANPLGQALSNDECRKVRTRITASKPKNRKEGKRNNETQSEQLLLFDN